MRTLIAVPFICLLVLIAYAREASAAEVCPSPPEFVIMWRCMNGTSDLGQIQRCAGRWGPDRLWYCMRSDPALSKLTLDDLRAAPAPPPAPPPSAALTCGPALAVATARAVEQANPGLDPATKYLAVQHLMAMYGCGAPPPPPSLPQTTDCRWIRQYA